MVEEYVVLQIGRRVLATLAYPTEVASIYFKSFMIYAEVIAVY